MRKISKYLMSALAIIGFAAPVAAQSNYPDRPVKLIVPFGPGGFTDVVARILGQKLSVAMGQQFVIENKPGAGSTIGTDFVAKAPADGYTLVMVSTAHVLGPWVYKKVPYDALKDFTVVSKLVDSAYVLTVNPKVPAKNVKEFIALAKANPDSIRYASSGNGGNQHLMGGLFATMTDTKIQHVPYKGSSGATNDLLAGIVESTFAAVPNVLPHIQQGKLRALAVTTSKRIPQLPDVPTLAEAGVPGYEASVWLALLAPANTPSDIVTKLNREIVKVLASPDTKKALFDAGVESAYATPEAMTAYMGKEYERWGKVIKDANITVQ
ncbi:tripartite tricarboxylate transporter substrate binding protein [Polynucleobacter sp. UK-Mo-2m-Kol15]|uniref:Bug family tripartite tricarboxylate transporter substrate binding protein n=1 Tax=Polynucleobacter sp. UK-Mo-2m-Kol15 TaxID=2576916 RepID=UPI001C0CCC75|nr:tripartite tricarboxylate transporter substrate binding protein [Polynucleobacter sp. UK-Mo-2m-Kol15]MBU3575111.1 tripartite tricarboxylate transporter substrate binding protein [Polynucleobacter sp. UK-Mo-2m-Kol15]